MSDISRYEYTWDTASTSDIGTWSIISNNTWTTNWIVYEEENKEVGEWDE